MKLENRYNTEDLKDIFYLSVKEWKKENNFFKNQLKKLLKEDKITSWIFLRKIPNNQRLYFLINNEKIILSFIHVYKTKNNELQFSYSYTPINKRRKGYNKKLRYHVIEKYKKKGFIYFTSIPFDGANSKNLLIKLGFKKEEEKYVYKI